MINDLCFEQAVLAEYPAEAMQYKEPKLRSLVSLCRELQRFRGDEAFYLGAPTIARLFEISEPCAARWMKIFVSDGVLRIHERGGTDELRRFRATEYFYCPGEKKQTLGEEIIEGLEDLIKTIKAGDPLPYCACLRCKSGAPK